MRDKLKQEATRRMKRLNLFGEAIQSFEQRDVIEKSEGPLGALFWLDEDEKRRVRDFENRFKEHEAMVYHVIIRYTHQGKLYTYLHVTKHDLEKDAINDFNASLRDNVIFTYLDAGDTAYTSEFGTEYVVPRFGGLHIPHVQNREAYLDLTKFKEVKED